MAMNTPIGNITQITPITSFVTLGSVALDQYILGINNFTQGDGSKVTLQNLIASMVNTTNEKNILGLDENGRLQAIEAVNPFGNDNGWAVAPTLTVNWTNRTVSGTGGKAYKDGFEITALSNFISPVFSSASGEYYLYYDVDAENFVWATSKPTTDYLIAKITVDSNSHKMAGAMYNMGGVSKTVSDFLNKALGTIVLSGGDISNVTTDEYITTNIYPQISATTIGTTDFNYTLPALTSNTFTSVKVTNNQLVYSTNQNGIVPLSENNLPVIIDSTGLETEIADGCALNIWLVGLPLFGESPSGMTYQFVTGSNQYEGSDIAKASSPNAEIAMQYIDDKYDRYAIIARFTILREGDNWLVADFDKYNPLAGGGGAGSVGITEVVSDPFYFSGLGIPSSPLTASPQTEGKLKQVVEDKENIYKVLEGHKSHNQNLWDLIEYHDATDKDVLLLGGTEETYTSNTSSSHYHFGLLNSIVGSNQPTAANALLAYKLFNNKFAATTLGSGELVLVADGTLTISCAKKMRISKIEIRSYNTNYTVPQLHVCAMNRDNPLASDVSLADFANARYIGGQTITKESGYIGTHESGYQGANRPFYLNMNEKDYYNTYFLCFDNWCSGSDGWNRQLLGVRIWGSQEETQDSDFEVGSDTLLKVCGDYDVLMNGKGYNKNAFTVVGNPTITRNGIASNFAHNTCVRPNFTLSNLKDKAWVIDITGVISDLSRNLVLFSTSENRKWSGYGGLWFSQQTETFALQISVGEGSDIINNEYVCRVDNSGVNIGDIIRTVLRFNGIDTYYGDIYINNVKRASGSFTPTTSNKNLRNIIDYPNQFINIGDGWQADNQGDFSWGGSIDLKQFSITVDGETVFNGGIEYENCEWVSSNGTVYNVSDLVEQYGEVPREKCKLDRWVSCLGHKFGFSASTQAADNFYPCFVKGVISTTGTVVGNIYQPCRQNDYMPDPRVGNFGYNSGSTDLEFTQTLNGTHIWTYTANDVFPAGEYFAEVRFGYNNALLGTTQDVVEQFKSNRCRVECLNANGDVVYKQSFFDEGSFYSKVSPFRTPRFYCGEPFKTFRVISLDCSYPNGKQVLGQVQLYYRDDDDTTGMSFIISPSEFDLSSNMVRHVTNKHFFITPTGVRVGSNCFVEKADPYPQMACVGNRWINENTRESWVCNESGKWVNEDFCEIACMTLWGTEHKGMRLRTVANYENPITHYVQDYGNLGGCLCFDDNLLANQLGTFLTSPEDPDFYFVAEAKDANEGVKFFYPANTVAIQAFRRQHVRSKIYESGEQYAHWSNCDHVGGRMVAYKTFETAAAGEYIEGVQEE